MKALKYHCERLGITSANTLTEFVNNTQARLNDDQPVQGNAQPYWELSDTVFMGDELLFIFACWEDRL